MTDPSLVFPALGFALYALAVLFYTGRKEREFLEASDEIQETDSLAKDH